MSEQTQYPLAILLAMFSPPVGAGPTRLAEPPTRTSFHRLVAVGQKAYQFGGFHEPADQLSIYDAHTNTWSSKSLPFVPGVSQYPAVIGGEIYLLDARRKTLRRYDPKADRWDELEPCPTKRVNGTVIGFEGKLYVIGGYSGLNQGNSVEAYDPKRNRWGLGPPLPAFSADASSGCDHFHLAAVLDGRLHIVGHDTGGKAHWVLEDGQWRGRADAPFACGWKFTALEAINGKLYLIDSAPNRRHDPKRSDIYAYEPSKDRWAPLGKVPDGFPIGPANVAIGDAIYFTGGTKGKHGMYRFDVKDKRWVTSGTGGK